MNSILNIFLLSLVAGLATGLGGLVVIIRKPGKKTFGFLMGVAAGVMISLAFLELVNEAWEQAGFLTATIGFGIGALFMFVVDFLIPHIRFGEREVEGTNTPLIAEETGHCQREKRLFPRHRHSSAESTFFGEDIPRHRHRRARRVHQKIENIALFRTGILIAFGIAIHNIPEGIAVGAGYMHAPQFGLFIALAIALHNIPEGIATALPLCKSGVRRRDALRAAFFSGLTEPIGAVLAALFLTSFSSLIPGSLAFAGGVMTFITLDELIPAAREYGHQHTTAMGIILGTIFIFVLSGMINI